MAVVLDHLVLVVPDLEAAVADLAERTGVRPVPGGSHVGLGTRNALAALEWEGGSRHYLELLSADPAQPDVPVERMMLGAGPVIASGVTRMLTWAVRTDPEELEEVLERARTMGIDVGQADPAARDTPAGQRLSWQLAVPAPLGLGGVQPFVIAWDDAHPTDSGLPALTLVSLTLLHPDPEAATAVLAALGLDPPVGHADEPTIRATVAGPGGEVVLG